MKIVLVALIALILSSCTPTYIASLGGQAGRELGLVDNYNLDRVRHLVLPPQATIYVPMTHNLKGKFVSRKITHYLSTSLTPKFRSVIQGYDLEGYEQALASARRNNVDFLIFATLTEWEDNINSREEYEKHEDLVKIGLDRIGLKFLTIDARSEHVVDMVSLTAESGMVTLYGDEPDQLLVKPLERYAKLISAPSSYR